MSRAARLFDLMQTLRRHRCVVSGRVLAQELGISLRTLYRDIEALRAVGAEIDGEPGLGYVLKPGFMLPPLMFSEEEIEALSLGLKWVEQRADDGLGTAASEALAKVAAVLPRELRHRLEDSTLLIGPGWDKPQQVDLAVLRQAIRGQNKLVISYCDLKSRRSSRLIWPFAIGFFETTRILVAWCELRQGFRHFRADRIETARVREERYSRRRHELLKMWRATLLPQSDSSGGYATSTPTDARRITMEQDIVFYTNPMSRGGIVHWMLEEIGVPYRKEVLAYGAEMKSPDYLAINPMGKVPAIQHGSVVVTEAAAICAYLADAFPEAGLAPPSGERGAYYRWLFFAAGPLETAIALKECGVQPGPEQQMQLGCGAYESVVDVLAAAVKERPYLAGEHFSSADIYVGSHIGWGMQFGTLPKRPEFVRYWQNLEARPAYQRVAEGVQQAMAEQSI
ncbi:HTH domain-containing protein [Halomonas sp. ML-15]|uniref:HTH domain-containing protein n=1 Tax=Halomonas sp. ML-15 TaxID=2773305 RepID=UPI0017475A02|nr:HTH domain-containing protein [Halomonas sp. ML-15]MBD3896255.1 HTH domain-containing protein [Halomonas sp. ML-15]